jgi:DNA-binding MarR family transcriptional regulator
LESKFDQPLIECNINPDDKRKVDVSLTDAGRKAHDKFRDARLGQTIAVLRNLDGRDVEDFMRVMARIREVMAPPPDEEE